MDSFGGEKHIFIYYDVVFESSQFLKNRATNSSARIGAEKGFETESFNIIPGF